MAEILNKQTPTIETSVAQIGIKLDGTNYALWSQVVDMNIPGKDKLGYINGDLPLSSQTDPTFRKWLTDNAIVKGSLSLSNGKSGMSSKSRTSSNGIKCSHCGNSKHTRENCFKLHGYLDWWHELQARKCHDKDKTEGKVAMVTIEPQLSLTPFVESSQGDYFSQIQVTIFLIKLLIPVLGYLTRGPPTI
ncbi:Retrotransposon Copia-like, N-terminal [Dillenia turbinata]|uniref:Retrotransposon Copia-like, N-terminal n=1 Tax=Dillenia turbinata TaxID=194707 RepID=A0AAN8VCK7_9MAGN